jgi:hypothetical protein
MPPCGVDDCSKAILGVLRHPLKKLGFEDTALKSGCALPSIQGVGILLGKSEERGIHLSNFVTELLRDND